MYHGDVARVNEGGAFDEAKWRQWDVVRAIFVEPEVYGAMWATTVSIGSRLSHFSQYVGNDQYLFDCRDLCAFPIIDGR